MSTINENYEDQTAVEQPEQSSKKDKSSESKKKIVTKESWCAVGALFSALAFLILCTGNLIFGQMGVGITELLMGLFGYFSYPLFLGLFYLCFTTFFGVKLVKNRKVGWFLALCLVSVCMLVHTATTAFQWSVEEYIGKCFVAGSAYDTATVCGLVGGLIVAGLVALISPIGTTVLFSVLTLLFGWLFVSSVAGKGKVKMERPAKKKQESIRGEQAPQPYTVPAQPTYSEPAQTSDPWRVPVSYSPFVSENSQSVASATNPYAPSESSRSSLFSNPADAYNRNLIFDSSARINNRPASLQTPTSSYTQAYEDSFQATEGMPQRVTTDYTQPAPSYSHPDLSSPRSDEGLLRDTASLRGEDTAQDTVAFTTPTRGENLSEEIPTDTFRGRDSDFTRPITPMEEPSRGLDRGFTRSVEQIDETPRGRGLFDDTPSVSIDTGRGEGRDAFVSPFADDDYEDVEDDFMVRDSRGEDTIDRTLETPPVDRLSTRIEEARATRFVEPTPSVAMPAPVVEPIEEEPPKPKYIRPYSPPPLHFFNCTEVRPDCDPQEVEENKNIILGTLNALGVKDAEISSVTYGPTVTRYNVMAPINALKKILTLDEEFAINLHAVGGVNVSLNYGGGVVCIEVPNRKRQFVHLGAMLTGEGFVSAKENSLTFALGVDVSNVKVYGDVAKMTHVLVAGASGMGKSAFLRSLIISLIYKYSPEELRLILIDPKMADFTLYTGIPHLVVNEIICTPSQAVQSLRWAIGEMERRYELFRRKSLSGTYVVNVDGYNANLALGESKLPKIVIIVDELADLMQVARKDVEDCILRLTAKARAAGIHMILATQRPSVDVVTGVIKSNLPTRIACAVASETDSRVILDGGGAEKLLGIGDMMYTMAGFKTPVRVQAPYVDDAPAQSIINYIRDNNDTDFNEEAAAYINKTSSSSSGGSGASFSSEEIDPVYLEALKYVIQLGRASISKIQRKCSIGFNRAAKIFEWMDEKHYIAEFDGSPKPRKTLITKEEYEQLYGEF